MVSRQGQPIEVEAGRRSAWIWGPWKPIDTAIRATGAPSMRCPKRKTTAVPITYLDDVISHLEYAQRRTVILRLASE